jgi:hypothetical protein
VIELIKHDGGNLFGVTRAQRFCQNIGPGGDRVRLKSFLPCPDGRVALGLAFSHAARQSAEISCSAL